MEGHADLLEAFQESIGSIKLVVTHMSVFKEGLDSFCQQCTDFESSKVDTINKALDASIDALVTMSKKIDNMALKLEKYSSSVSGAQECWELSVANIDNLYAAVERRIPDIMALAATVNKSFEVVERLNKLIASPILNKLQVAVNQISDFDDKINEFGQRVGSLEIAIETQQQFSNGITATLSDLSCTNTKLFEEVVSELNETHRIRELVQNIKIDNREAIEILREVLDQWAKETLRGASIICRKRNKT